MMANTEDAIAPGRVRSVSELVSEIKLLLQAALPPVWVEGEVSNLKRAGSGHCYFSLKDEHAQISAVLWRSDAMRLRFEMADGLHVLAFGEVDVYASRGQMQLSVRRVVPRGIGALELAFRQLCERLSAEGLFRPDRKRPLPCFPRRVALVTSPRGAAIRDFLEVAGRRWRGAEIIVVPAAVQGDDAPAELCGAIALAQRIDADAIALVRGGGSIEDLWAFNDEFLARAIVASQIPVITGIGHEVDVTIADLVSDVRALTPTEAAERLFPDAGSISTRVEQAGRRLAVALRTSIDRASRRLDTAATSPKIRRPLEWVRDAGRRADEMELVLLHAFSRWRDLVHRRLELASKSLAGASPLHLLDRGYSLTARERDGKVVRSVSDVAPESRLVTRVRDGRIYSRVEQTEIEDAGSATEL